MRPFERSDPLGPRPDDASHLVGGSGKRILFLDDEETRAAAFLSVYPEAVWVRSASECLEQLAHAWDEVHLDHDLGGETYVDMEREDCGMAVVRWLCREPRGHLIPTRFVVHTRNANASCVMLLHLREVGFEAEARPFSIDQAANGSPGNAGILRRLAGWMRRGLSGHDPTKS